MNDPTGLDERPVEEALRQILDPLDRQLEYGRTLLAAALMLVVPALFLWLWLVKDELAIRALGWSGLGFGLLLVLGFGWELLMERVVRRRFERRFPAGSPARAVALRILAQMETPSKAEEKLRDLLAATSPDRIVRHRPPEAPAPLLELPPEVPEPPPAPPASQDTNPAPRPGGYYDYIPLEPRSAEDEKTGRDRKGAG
jgi:hypothetical protein